MASNLLKRLEQAKSIKASSYNLKKTDDDDD